MSSCGLYYDVRKPRSRTQLEPVYKIRIAISMRVLYFCPELHFQEIRFCCVIAFHMCIHNFMTGNQVNVMQKENGKLYSTKQGCTLIEVIMRVLIGGFSVKQQTRTAICPRLCPVLHLSEIQRGLLKNLHFHLYVNLEFGSLLRRQKVKILNEIGTRIS